MAFYEYKCINENCSKKDIVETVSIPMNEYSEEKLLVCEECKQKTVRNYTTFAHQIIVILSLRFFRESDTL